MILSVHGFVPLPAEDAPVDFTQAVLNRVEVHLPWRTYGS